MPRFESDIDVDVDEFYDELASHEKEKLITLLTKDGYLPEYVDTDVRRSAPEQIFEDALNKLHGNWNRLTVEDESMIMEIANRVA